MVISPCAVAPCPLALLLPYDPAPPHFHTIFRTSTAQAAQDLHHDVMFFVITISVLVVYLIYQV